MQTDADICSLALLRIGQRQAVTTPLANDTTPQGKVCSQIYPAARDALLGLRPWRFATKSSWLYEAGKIAAAANPEPVPGWLYTYVLPADLLEARYLFDGARPGQPLLPSLVGEDLIDLVATPELPILNGIAPQASFEVASGLLFSDLTDLDGPPAWDATVTSYAQGAVVSYLGQAFVALQVLLVSHTPDPTQDTAYWARTQAVQLVYTQQVTDVTKMPQLFADALVWRVAMDLALSMAVKPQLAEVLDEKAERALTKAVAAENNAIRPDRRPDSKFITVRR